MKGSKDKSKSSNRRDNTRTKSESSVPYPITLRYFHQFLSNYNVKETFGESVFQPQYDMAMTLIVFYLLAHYLSIFNGFGATIAVFFIIVSQSIKQLFYIYFFHSPNSVLIGIDRGINTADNPINMAKATTWDTSRDANCRNLNEILCNSSELSLVGEKTNTGMEDGLIRLFFDVIMAGIPSTHAIATVGIEFVLKLVISVAMVVVAVITIRKGWKQIKLVVI